MAIENIADFRLAIADLSYRPFRLPIGDLPKRKQNW
jgi:hypothetical protein